MNLTNKLLSNLEKCKDRCQLSLTMRTLNGENNICGCEGLTCDKCEEQANVMLDEWRKELNDNGWIPVEERLPENEVLCCDECGHMLVGYIFKDEYSNTGYNAESDNESIQNVVAWMPLPTPYKKEKQDEIS